MDQATQIDRHTCERIVPMKVLALGLGRTGTHAMRKALRLLGYHDVYHGYSATFENPKDFDMWREAMQAKYDGVGKPFGREEFDKLLGHCQAVSGIPAACFGSELIKAYPEAKVILNGRDIDEWHKSVMNSLVAEINSFGASFASFLAWVVRSPNRHTRPFFLRLYGKFFQGSVELNGKRIYAEHYDTIRGLVHPQNLLEYQVRDGWEPLCKFLGTPVPDCPFPQCNDKVEIKKKIRSFIRWQVGKAAGSLLRVFAITFFFYWLLPCIRGCWQ